MTGREANLASWSSPPPFSLLYSPICPPEPSHPVIFLGESLSVHTRQRGQHQVKEHIRPNPPWRASEFSGAGVRSIRASGHGIFRKVPPQHR